VILNRLRLGTCKIPAVESVLQPSIDPICETCNQIYDVEHYLLHCKRFDAARSVMITQILRLNTFNLSLSSLLNVNDAVEIHSLIEYIKTTGKYYDI
jgi:hypothetical protein